MRKEPIVVGLDEVFSARLGPESLVEVRFFTLDFGTASAFTRVLRSMSSGPPPQVVDRRIKGRLYREFHWAGGYAGIYTTTNPLTGGDGSRSHDNARLGFAGRTRVRGELVAVRQVLFFIRDEAKYLEPEPSCSCR